MILWVEIREVLAGLQSGPKYKVALSDANLKETLSFQKSYTSAICKYMEARFSDNNNVSAFEILNLSNNLFKRIDLNSWGVIDLKLLLHHYAMKKQIDGKSLSFLLNSNEYRRDFFNLKLEGTLD